MEPKTKPFYSNLKKLDCQGVKRLDKVSELYYTKDCLTRWSVGQGVKTPPFHGGNTGSNPVRTILYSAIAQSVERMTVNHDVTGSSPVGGVNLSTFRCFFHAKRGGRKFLPLLSLVEWG